MESGGWDEWKVGVSGWCGVGVSGGGRKSRRWMMSGGCFVLEAVESVFFNKRMLVTKNNLYILIEIQ